MPIANCRVISPSDMWGQPQSDNISGSCTRAPTSGLRFEAYKEDFHKLFPSSQFPTVKEPFVERHYAFAHEGPVYIRASNQIFFVSNRFSGKSINPASVNDKSNQSVGMYTLHLDDPGSLREVRSGLKMANGATIDCATGRVLLLSQGLEDEFTQDFIPSSVSSLDAATGDFEILVNNVFGMPFNSLNDIVQDDGGTLWFTDPAYGSEAGFRSRTNLQPDAVYALSPGDPAPRMVAMQTLSRPNGIALSPDGKVLYVTDTGMAMGGRQSRVVYAFDIIGRESGTPVLNNQRLFYSCVNGAPDGIKLDSLGNIYLGIGNGVAVLSPHGELLGRILTPSGTGVTQLVFGGEDYKTLVLLAETKIWKVGMAVDGALQCPSPKAVHNLIP